MCLCLGVSICMAPRVFIWCVRVCLCLFACACGCARPWRVLASTSAFRSVLRACTRVLLLPARVFVQPSGVIYLGLECPAPWTLRRPQLQRLFASVFGGRAAPLLPPSPSPSVGSTGRPWRSLRNALDLGTPRRALPRLPGPRPGHHGRRPKCSVCARALFLPPLGASWHPCLALLPTLRALTNTCANSYRLYKNILHSRQWIHGQWMF